MEWQVPLSDLDYGVEEEEAALDVIRRRWLTMGAITQEFEQAFARLTGAKHALAVSNATLALHLANLALGIGPGDEVIVPSLTFVATANSVLYTGAEVRFAEINGPGDLNISPEDVQKQITPKTKAIQVVHIGGYACNMPAILDIARRHNLVVIEDCAHAPGAYLNGQHLGTWGDVGCFSFFSNKNLSTGEGGMVITNRDDVAEKVRLLRSHGMTSLTWDRHKGHAYTYDVVELGFNYRIDEIRSALGLAQIKKLPAGNARRKLITEHYWQELQHIPGVDLPFCDSAAQSSHHIFPMLLPEGTARIPIIDKLRAQGVQTSIHYPPIHKFTYYQQRYPGLSLPVTEAVAAREITLPLYPGMTDEQVEIVTHAVKEGVKS